jgi:hypothetical protein
MITTAERKACNTASGRGILLGKAVDNPLDPLSQPLYVEIDDQAECSFRETKIGPKLCEVQSIEALECFHFNDPNTASDVCAARCVS